MANVNSGKAGKGNVETTGVDSTLAVVDGADAPVQPTPATKNTDRFPDTDGGRQLQVNPKVQIVHDSVSVEGEVFTAAPSAKRYSDDDAAYLTSVRDPQSLTQLVTLVPQGA